MFKKNLLALMSLIVIIYREVALQSDKDMLGASSGDEEDGSLFVNTNRQAPQDEGSSSGTESGSERS